MAVKADASIVVIQPDDGKDAEINSRQPNTNFGDWVHLTTNWWHAAVNSGLLQFDITALSGMTITNATLSLYHITNSALDSSWGVYRVTDSWDEMAVTWNTQPGVAAASDSLLNITDNSAGLFRDWDVTALVQSWTDGAYDNYGMMLTRTDAPNPYAYFASSDWGSNAFDPKLTITYTTPNMTTPEPGTLALLGLGLLGITGLRKIKRG